MTPSSHRTYPRWTPAVVLSLGLVFSLATWIAVGRLASNIAMLAQTTVADHGWSRQALFEASRNLLPTGRSVSHR